MGEVGSAPAVGDPIEQLRVTPDRYLTHRYAGASGDFNPIHIDEEFAQSVGLPGKILHGLYSMALVSRAAIAVADHDPRALKRLSVQFRGMGVPEKEIVVSGAVTSVEAGRVEMELAAEQDGTKIIRNAEATIEPE